MKLKIQVAILVAFLLSTTFIVLPSPTSWASGTASDAIRINNDVDLAAQAVAMGWPGNGSDANPYIISNLTIDHPINGIGIYVGNTSSHIIIENCSISNAFQGLYPYRDGNGIRIYSCQNVMIRNNWLNASYNGIALIYGSATTDNIVIQNNTIENSTHDGIYCTGLDAYKYIDNLFLIENKIINSGYGGIETTNAFSSKICNNSVVGSYNGILTYHSTSANIEYNKISSNVLIQQYGYGFGIGQFSCYDGRINNNSIVQTYSDDFPYWTGIYLSSSYRTAIFNNSIANALGDGIGINDSDSNSIRENIIKYSQSGIKLSYSNETAVNENTIINALSNGISLEYSYNNDVSSNNIVDATSSGIQLQYSGFNNIYGNKVRNSTYSISNIAYCGIYQKASAYNNFTFNVIENYRHGIYLNGVSQVLGGGEAHEYTAGFNNVTHNFITNSSFVGIYVDSFSETIAWNTVNDSTSYGLHIYWGSDNKIFGNRFINNNGAGSNFNPTNVQAYVGNNQQYYSFNNDWNATIGNYWSDWTSPDTNQDGVIDTPYPVGKSNRVTTQQLDMLPIAPQIIITNPSSDVFTTNKSSIELHGWASNHFGIQEIIAINEATGQVFHCDGTTQWSVQGIALREGVNRIIVKMFSVDGFESNASILIICDQTVPQIQIGIPITGSYYNVSTVTISWMGLDDETGIVYYEVSIDGGEWTNCSTQDSYTSANLAEGQHSVEVRATDGAGNSNIISSIFYVDTVAPYLELTTPSEGLLTNVTTIEVRWISSDDGSGLGFTRMRVDGGPWSAVGSSISVLLLTSVPDGTHMIEVESFDFAGNVATACVNITIDAALPTISIISPVQDSSLVTDNVRVRWTSSGTGSPIACTEIRLDGDPWIDVHGASSLEFNALSDGPHTICVKVRDAAGNVNELVVSFSVAVPPSISAHSPSGEDAPVDTVIIVTFSEPMNKSSVRVAINGITGNIAWAGNTISLVPSIRLSYGASYVVQVYGKDIAGNAVDCSWAFTTMSRGTIDGVVTDPNGNPLADATVTLGNGLSTMTDSNGHFTFSDVAAGTYDVTVSKAGYRSFTNSITVDDGEIIDLGHLSVQSNSSDNAHRNDGLLVASVLFIVAIVGTVCYLKLRRGKKGT